MIEDNVSCVSIIMITYNHEKYIAQAIEGVMMQKTNFPIELIIGEDCSSDHTREVCIAYQEKYPEIIKLNLPEQNLGVNKNFLEIIKIAKGKYIALCEGDDYWTDPMKLQKQIDFLEANKDYSLCFHNCIIKSMEQNEEWIFHKDPLQDTYETKDILREWFIPTASIVYRNFDDFKFPEWFIHCQSGDIPLLLLLSVRGKFKYINEPMSVYRYHQASTSWSHYGYNKAIGMTYIYQCFNVYTNYRFSKEIEEAIIYEMRRLLPEILELNQLKEQIKISEQSKEKHILPNKLRRFPSMAKRILKKILGKK